MSNVVEFPQYDLDDKMAQKIYSSLFAASTPDDVLGLAEGAYGMAIHLQKVGGGNPVEAIAKAIMAERVRCALLLHERYTSGEDEDPLDPAIFEIIEAMLSGEEE